MSKFKFYEVGGKIRDEFLGLSSKDVDYVVVPSEELLNEDIHYVLGLLYEYLRDEGFKIFLCTEKCFTIRAQFPNRCDGCSGNHNIGLCARMPCEKYSNKWNDYCGVADFVLARKEIGYIKGTRTPICVPGNLYDDLSRRDFTVNAIAKDIITGEYIDFFNGIQDIKDMTLRTPLDPVQTFDDDPLRILRGIRFAITKNFNIDSKVSLAIIQYDYSKMSVVSEERIREELFKCFKYNTLQTIYYLTEKYFDLWHYINTYTKIWLKPTIEKQ